MRLHGWDVEIETWVSPLSLVPFNLGTTKLSMVRYPVASFAFSTPFDLLADPKFMGALKGTKWGHGLNKNPGVHGDGQPRSLERPDCPKTRFGGL